MVPEFFAVFWVNFYTNLIGQSLFAYIPTIVDFHCQINTVNYSICQQGGPASLLDFHTYSRLCSPCHNSNVNDLTTPSTCRNTSNSAVHLPAQGSPLQFAHHISWTDTAVHPTGLCHLVSHAPLIVHAHDVEIAQQHGISRSIVFDNPAQGTSIHAAVDHTAWTDTDTALQRVVSPCVCTDLQVSKWDHQRLQHKFAFNYICFYALYRFGDFLFIGNIFFLFDVHTDSEHICFFAPDIFIADINTSDTGAF